ncbi:MAG: hypothetical protein Q8R91_07470 [Candidatus Omnitrophota bacterium]|nr:hypothetical protein [Candidatus Omnitrophota bacterium]
MEYAILIGIVTAAIVGMQTYAKRGIQAGIKLAADQLGDQLQGVRYESGDRQDKVVREGTLLERESAVATVVDHQVNTRTDVGGSRTATTLRDTTETRGVVTDQRLPAAEFPFCRDVVVGEGRANVSVCAAVATAVQ